jgi:amylosucrase
MLLVIDYVMNHTAREHQWAQAALKGDPHFQDFYLLFDDRTLPDAYERSLPEVFPDFAPGNFTWQPEIQKWAWTTFYDFQWDLNYRNPDVFEAMLEEMLFLANVGVDVLRLDAVPFLWKNVGTNCQNQQEAIHILAAYRALVRMVAPGMLFKSEAIVAPEDIIRYLGSGGLEGKVCEIGYNATLMNHLWQALAAENTHLLRTTLSGLPAIPKEATWINYIRCHDDIGWGISDENAAAVGQSGRGTRNYCTDFYAGVLPQSYAEGYVFQRDRQTGEARTSGTAAALTGLQKALVEADASKIDILYAKYGGEQHSANALPSGVLPEQVHPLTGGPISVSPLTWSHAAVVSAMVAYVEKYRQMSACPSCGQHRTASEEASDALQSSGRAVA